MYITVEFAPGSVFSDCVHRAAKLAWRSEVCAVKFTFNGISVLAHPSAQYRTKEVLDEKLSDAYKNKDNLLVLK